MPTSSAPPARPSLWYPRPPPPSTSPTNPPAQFNGSLASVPAPILGANAIRAALSRTSLPPSALAAAYMGNVLSAGMGQSPARQAVLSAPASLQNTLDCTTVNKVCASGLKSVALAAQAIALGDAPAALAGGMESMSRVPYYLPRGTQFPPFGEVAARDGMIADGLWDPYNDVHMGKCGERAAQNHNLTREAQDAFAIESYARAQRAAKEGLFDAEIEPVTVRGRKGDTVVRADEGPTRIQLDKVPTLRPAFDKAGTVTAANSSSFNDGAAALVLAEAALAREHGAGSGVLARVVSSADAALDPMDFPIAPAAAVPIALARAGLGAEDIAHWEINEAFASVVLANAKLLGLEGRMERVNPVGGAIALGHAIGSSGARILVTMLHRLKVGEFGCAAICNGGGAATAMIVQRVDHV